MASSYVTRVLFAVVVCAVILPSPTPGVDYSFTVRNGEQVDPIRCLSAGRQQHKWEAYRVEGNSIGEPIDVTDFKRPEGYLTFVANDTFNTGYYHCDAVDERIYDKYVVLTDAERLHISPPVLRVNSSRIATITINFIQFEGTPEHPKTFHVFFSPDTTSDKFEFEPIRESRIQNGVASFTFNTTENGTISVEAEFRVGTQNDRVTSNVVRVILEKDPILPISVNEKKGSESAISPGLILGIAVAIVLVLAVAVVSCAASCNVIVYVWLWRPRRQRLKDDDDISMRTAAEEEVGLDGQNANAQHPIPP